MSQMQSNYGFQPGIGPPTQAPSKLEAIAKAVVALKTELEVTEQVVRDLCGSWPTGNCPEKAASPPPPTLAGVLISMPDVLLEIKDRVALIGRQLRDGLV